MASEEDSGLDLTSRFTELSGERLAGTDTLDVDTGEPVFLPFRMSCFVISNLVVTAGMLTPGLKVRRSPPGHDTRS